MLAVCLIPDAVMAEHRATAARALHKPVIRVAAVAIAIAWIMMLSAIGICTLTRVC